MKLEKKKKKTLIASPVKESRDEWPKRRQFEEVVKLNQNKAKESK